jgi:hypothetical protein
MANLVSNDVLVALGILSVVFFLGTLIAVPILILKIPADYFDEQRGRTWLRNRHPAVRLIGYGLKNLLGVVFVLAGIAMLILPGQGILTILIGLSLMDFRRKRELQRRLISHPTVFQTINKLREKFGRQPLVLKTDAS